MRDEDERSIEHGQRTFELLDGREVEMVRRLVEHEAAGTARRLQRELGPRPLAGRQAPRSPEHVVRVEVELGEQRSRFTFAQRRFRAEGADQRLVRREDRSLLSDLAEDD